MACEIKKETNPSGIPDGRGADELHGTEFTESTERVKSLLNPRVSSWLELTTAGGGADGFSWLTLRGDTKWLDNCTGSLLLLGDENATG